MKSKFYRIYMCGVFTTLGVSSLLQDCYGKERYLRHVEEFWVDPIITVPLAIIVIVASHVWAHKD